MSPHIIDINLRVSQQEFTDEVAKTIDDYKASTGHNMSYGFSSATMRRSGKTVIIHELTCDGGGVTFKIVSEKDDASNDLIFTPMKIKNVSNSFFATDCSDTSNTSFVTGDNDPSSLMLQMLAKLAASHKGTLACIYCEGNCCQIVNSGSKKTYETLAIVDTDGHVYSGGKGTVSDLSNDDDDGPTLNIKTPINVWIKQTPDVAAAVNGIKTVDGKMNYIGKYLIGEKLKGNIDYSDFMDIFLQAGVFGFSDPTVINFYKLLT